MYTLAYFTTLVALTATTVGAVPLNHASAHQNLHRRDVSPHLVKLAPLQARAPEPLNISPIGQCGGDSGYQCASSMCCSKWGYCGTGDDYCGSGSGNDTSSATVSAEEWTSTSAAAYTPPATYTTLATTTAVATSAAATSVAATSAAATSAAAPSTPAAPSASASSTSTSSGGWGKGNTYTFYSGSGATSAGWPSMGEWASFESLWTANEPTIAISCTQFGAANPSTQEISDIKSAIMSVGASSGVDPRFILAIMMQESKGCPRVPTTNYGHANPGLMQSYEGSSCATSDPCPASTITQMIQDGAVGTSAGPGLKDDMTTVSASGAQQYYQTARIYNAGSLSGDNLGAPGATECYCSDVANRLTGWTTAATECTLS